MITFKIETNKWTKQKFIMFYDMENCGPYGLPYDSFHEWIPNPMDRVTHSEFNFHFHEIAHQVMTWMTEGQPSRLDDLFEMQVLILVSKIISVKTPIMVLI